MSRPQVSDQFGNQALQTQARPIAQAFTSQQPVDTSAWQALGNVFAAGEMLNEKNSQAQAEADTQRATSYAQSMTVAELGKRIKEDKMLASESPVFAATVQHIFGQNTHDALEREVQAKVSTGELKFNSPEEIDTYLTEARNTALSGQSAYAGAGFDKGYTRLRTGLMDSAAKVNNAEIVARAEREASDSLSNTLLKVTDKAFTGTTQAAAEALMSQYQLLRTTKVMPDSAAKGALLDVITRAAGSGQTALLDSLLNADLPDLGSVRSFLGEAKAQTLTNNAKTRFDQGQRQRIDDESLPWMQAAEAGTLKADKFMAWAQSPANKEYTSSAMIQSLLGVNANAQAAQQRRLEQSFAEGAVLKSEHEAMKRVDAALTGGVLHEVQGPYAPTVVTMNGGVASFDVKSYAEQSLLRRTEKMPIDRQISAWSLNGLIHPGWKAQMDAGLFNLASIGLDSKGKPVGQLNAAALQSIALFRQLDAVNPDAAKRTAGDDGYKRFSDVAFLMHLGRDPSDAAAIASSASQGALAGSSTAKLDKQVRAEVDKLVDTPLLDWLANTRDEVWDVARRNNPVALAGALLAGTIDTAGGTAPEWLKIDPKGTAMRNEAPNTAQVHAMVKRYATLLAHSGQVGTPEAAIKTAVEYISRPEVTAKVNGTLYLRSELPPGIPGKTQEEALEQFINMVPKAEAQSRGFSGDEVRLEFDERSRVYRAFVAGVPLTNANGGVMAFNKSEIHQFYINQRAVEVQNAIRRKIQDDKDKRAPASTPRDSRIMGLTPKQFNSASQPLAPK